MSKKSRYKKSLKQSPSDTGLLQSESSAGNSSEKKVHTHNLSFGKKLLHIYDVKYKWLILITSLLLVLSIIQIGYQYSTTGDFINKGISLKGGVSITFVTPVQIDTNDLQNFLLKNGFDVNVRSIKEFGQNSAVVVDADMVMTDQPKVNLLLSKLREKTGLKLEKGDYNLEGFGSNLSKNFFKETFFALIGSFILMSLVVVIYFRVPIPSVIVIVCALSDMLMTIAAVNLLGIKISTAGIAAFLMLIGYSVDTDILLTSRVLKRKEGTVFDRCVSSMKTGIMMSASTMIVTVICIFFSQSEVITQIMTIIFIGMIFDILNTWIQNVALLRYYLERKGIK